MPYVTVVFNPEQISQDVVDKLKPILQHEVARILSSDAVSLHPDDISISPEEIMVTQHNAHPTDVNVPPLEIYIQAGRPKGRSESRIVELLGETIAETGLIPDEHLGEGKSGIFIVFHEHNGFGFIPKRP